MCALCGARLGRLAAQYLSGSLQLITVTGYQEELLCHVFIYLFTPHRCSFANGMAVFVYLCVLFVEAAGKIAREEGKLDLGSMPEDGFLDNLSLPPTAAELVSNPHSSRSERSTHRDNFSVTPQTVFIMWKYETVARSQI